MFESKTNASDETLTPTPIAKNPMSRKSWQRNVCVVFQVEMERKERQGPIGARKPRLLAAEGPTYCDIIQVLEYLRGRLVKLSSDFLVIRYSYRSTCLLNLVNPTADPCILRALGLW